MKSAILMNFIVLLSLVVTSNNSATARPNHYNIIPLENSFPISVSTDHGYRQVSCPVGTRMTSCQLQTSGYSCDNENIAPHANVCGADSHKNRLCTITAICAKPTQPHYSTYTRSVVSTDGAVTCARPDERKVGRCEFWGSCDNQRELNRGCYADSKNHKRCNMSVTCVSYY